MNTKLMTAHEEEYVHNDKKRIIGVFLNFSTSESESFTDSIPYTYKDGVYIFFTTIIDMIDYLLYGEKFKLRAYMKESEFDEFFDAEYIEGPFKDYLSWNKRQE